MTTLDVATLAFAQITTNAKGAKTLPALCQNGDPVTWQIADLMECPFDASAYNDVDNTANRVTLCLTPSSDVCDAMMALDEWCVQTLSQNPTALLGVQLTPEQVKERYVSCLKTSEKGYTTLRTKMNRAGRYALQAYTPTKEKRSHPESWRGCYIQPQLTFKGLYIMGREFGPVLECSHAVVFESKGDECPFKL